MFLDSRESFPRRWCGVTRSVSSSLGYDSFCMSLELSRNTLLRMIHASLNVASDFLFRFHFSASLCLPLPSFFPLPFPIQIFSLSLSHSFSLSLSFCLYVRIVVVCLSRTSTSHDTATSMDGRGLALHGRCDLFNCIERADGNRFSTVGRGHVCLPTWYTPVLRPANRPRLGPVSQPILNC